MQRLVRSDGVDGRGRRSDPVLKVLYAAGQSSDLALELLFGIGVSARQGRAVRFDAVGSDAAVEVIVGRGILFAKVGDDGSKSCV